MCAKHSQLGSCTYNEPVYCGARTRKGTPCLRKDIYRNGRCKLHGGWSTGPKSKKGRAQSAINGTKGGRPKKHNLDPVKPTRNLTP